MSTDVSDHPDLRTDEQRQTAWERLEEGARRGTAAAPPSVPTARPKGPAHARPLITVAAAPKRQHLAPALAGLAAILLLVTLAVVVSRALHPATAATGSSAPPAHAASSTASPPPALARLEAGSNDAVSATAAARAEFASMKGLPTTAGVALVVNPYVDSLQLYATLLASTSTSVPASAQASERTLASQVRADVDFLEGINGLNPAELGSYLNGFFTHAAVLQAELGALERDLGVHSG